MYFPDEPLNEKDPIHLVIPAGERPRAIARDKGGVLCWDVVMRGRHQSHFEDDHD